MEYIFIGPGKTGSTWLRVALTNTNISLAKDIKETNFYSDYFSRGRGWYEAFFNSDSWLDIGNTYIYSDLAIDRILAKKDVKLIIAYRDLETRISSMFHFDKRNGIVAENLALEEYLKLNFVRQKIFLSSRIEKIITSNIDFHVWNYNNFQRDNTSEFNALCDFMNLDIDYSVNNIGTVNQAKKLRFSTLRYLSRPVASLLRKYDAFKVLNFFKMNRLLNRILYVNLNDKKLLDINLSNEYLEEDLLIRRLLNIDE